MAKLRLTVVHEYEMSPEDCGGVENPKDIAAIEQDVFEEDPFMIAEAIEGGRYTVTVEVL